MANGYLLQGIGGGLQQGLNTILQLVEAQRDREARARELAEQRAFTSGEARLGREHETNLSDSDRAARQRQFDLQQLMQAQGMNLESETAARREFLEGLRSQDIVPTSPGAYEAVRGRDINAGLDPSTLRKFEVSPQDLIRGQRTAPAVSPERLPELFAGASAKARAAHSTVPVEGLPFIASSKEFDPYRSSASYGNMEIRREESISKAIDRAQKSVQAAMASNPRASQLKGLLAVVQTPQDRARALEELTAIGAAIAKVYYSQDPLLKNLDTQAAGADAAAQFELGAPAPSQGEATPSGLGLPSIPQDATAVPTAPSPPAGGGSSMVTEFLQRRRGR